MKVVQLRDSVLIKTCNSLVDSFANVSTALFPACPFIHTKWIVCPLVSKQLRIFLMLRIVKVLEHFLKDRSVTALSAEARSDWSRHYYCASGVNDNTSIPRTVAYVMVYLDRSRHFSHTYESITVCGRKTFPWNRTSEPERENVPRQADSLSEDVL
nr:unnamed protein product [Callosobruchus chinensis]